MGGETGKEEMRRNGREGGRKDDEKGGEVQERIQRG